ncbi:hypothetical protein PCURB6_09520 [Paenibacillus curdlanolyticus]|nr:hypothetical protein PCURB6_09520 [Paenibacillus curdlanolyticus]
MRATRKKKGALYDAEEMDGFIARSAPGHHCWDQYLVSVYI